LEGGSLARCFRGVHRSDSLELSDESGAGQALQKLSGAAGKSRIGEKGLRGGPDDEKGECMKNLSLVGVGAKADMAVPGGL
jgi:hypothetical protein